MALHALIWNAAFAAALVLASWKGGRDERLTALVIALADAASILHHLALHPHGVDLSSVALDVLLLGFFAHRALVTTRWWPLYACAAQSGVCLGLAATALQIAPLIEAYWTFSTVWSYGIVLALVAGTTLEQDRVREERTSR